MATQPSPKKSPQEEMDEVEEKIDSALIKIHEKADSVKKGETPPGASDTKAFRPENVKKTQQAFQSLASDRVLTDSNEDIKLKPEDRNTPPPGQSKSSFLRFRKAK